MFRIGRILPPASSPIYFRDILNGIKGISAGYKEIDRFRQEIQSYFGVHHCFLTSSGKAALTIILQALKQNQPERKKVIVPAYNCYSVPSAITRAGLKMELCEMDPKTFDFNFNCLADILGCKNNPSIKKEKQKDILAILPTHFFGIPSDIQRVKQLISDPEIMVVEDAAQSMGEKSGGDLFQGIRGDVGFFSLGRGKAFSVVEGGIILTNRQNVANAITVLSQEIPSYSFSGIMKLILQSGILWLFMLPRLFWIPKSLPFLKLGETIYDTDFPIKKMTSFQAGLARGWQKKLAWLQGTRKNNVKKWLDCLPEDYYPFLIKHKTNPPACIRLPIWIRNENLLVSLIEQSSNRGWGVMPTYPNPLDIILNFEQNGKLTSFPSARDLCQEIVTLPVHPFVVQQDIENICKIILNKASSFSSMEH